MDLINKAKDWKQVDEQLTHEVPGHLTRETRKIPSNGILTLKVIITYPGRGNKPVLVSIPAGVITGPYTDWQKMQKGKILNKSVYSQIQRTIFMRVSLNFNCRFFKASHYACPFISNKMFFTRQLKSFSYELFVHQQRRSQALSSFTQTPWVQLRFDKEARWSAR